MFEFYQVLFTLASVMSVRRRMKEIRKVGMLTDLITGPAARKRMTLMVNILLLRPSNALLAPSIVGCQ